MNPQDRAAISRALRMATCLWGGKMCPLIPVMQRLPPPWRLDPILRASPQKITRGLLDFFEPDALVETAVGQLAAIGIGANVAWPNRNRFRGIDQMLRTEPGRKPYLDLGLSMQHVYGHLFRSEFQFKKRVDPRILLFEGGDRVATAFFEACYGLFPEEEALADMRGYYRDAFAAEVVEPTVDAWSAIERGEAGYPLYYTIRGLDQRFEGGWNETIFVFDPLVPGDVIDFWNARLFMRNVMPVNARWLAASRDLVVERIRRGHRPLPSNPNGVMISTTVHVGRSLNVDTIVEELKLRDCDLPAGSYALQGWYEPIWTAHEGDFISRPMAAPLVAKSVEVQLVPNDRDGLRIPALSPDNVEFTRGGGPSWVNVVRTRIYGGTTRYADAMPSAGLAAGGNYPPRAHVVQVPTREGHVTFHSHAHDGSDFVLTTRHEAIASWLKAQGIDAEPSDAGRVAEELLSSVGGLSGVGLLAHPEAIRQFDKMARSRATHANGDSEEFPDRTATVGQLKAMLRQVNGRPYGVHVTLERFVRAGVLRLGVAVRCTHCTKENWYSLDDVASAVKCERCLKSFDYPQGQVPSRDTWKYRVIGPFATPHFAQGGYSVALTLRFLEHELGSPTAFTYATSLLLKRATGITETDFFAWHGEHAFSRARRDPALIVGECKSFGVELFKPDDVKRLKQLGEMLPGAYLIAATLKPSLSNAERRRLRSLAEWGWRRRRNGRSPSRLIVLTGTELFALGPLYNAWIEAGGTTAAVAERYSHVFDLETLAAATQEAHLGFSDEDLSALRWPRRKGALRPVLIEGTSPPPVDGGERG